jgi:hypothetical protein
MTADGINASAKTAAFHGITCRSFYLLKKKNLVVLLDIQVVEGVLSKSFTETSSGNFLVQFTVESPAEEFNTIFAAVGECTIQQ